MPEGSRLEASMLLSAEIHVVVKGVNGADLPYS